MTPLEADIAWYRRQIDNCRAALSAVLEDPPSPSRSIEGRILVETLGRYQVTLDHLVHIKQMADDKDAKGSGK